MMKIKIGIYQKKSCDYTSLQFVNDDLNNVTLNLSEDKESK